MPTIAEAVEKLLEYKIATPDQIIGCSAQEIEEISKDQGVILPQIYRDFLTTMGRGAGSLFIGTDVYYRHLLRLKTDLIVELEAANSGFKLEENAFVYYSHQGYMWEYFLCEEGIDDPLTYYIGDSNKYLPEISSNSFSEGLINTINSTAALIKHTKKRV